MPHRNAEQNVVFAQRWARRRGADVPAPRTVTIRDGKIGGEGRLGEEYAVVTADGLAQQRDTDGHGDQRTAGFDAELRLDDGLVGWHRTPPPGWA